MKFSYKLVTVATLLATTLLGVESLQAAPLPTTIAIVSPGETNVVATTQIAVRRRHRNKKRRGAMRKATNSMQRSDSMKKTEGAMQSGDAMMKKSVESGDAMKKP